MVGMELHKKEGLLGQNWRKVSVTEFLNRIELGQIAMTKALDQLAELVRQAEAKTRARRIESETQQVAEQFRLAEQRSRRAVERNRIVRPAKLQTLEQADTDEQLLKDLIRKLALYRSSLGSQADAEKLIAASQAEIERTRRENRAELEEISRELEEARRELRAAIDTYRQLRRELDRLQPELAVQFGAEDHLLWDAEAHFPGGQLQLLAHEVEAALSAYASMSKLEQYARLKVWIGRFRFYQASQDREAELNDELQALSHRVFHQLKWLSRQYEPGYIEAFRQDFSTDWAAYVTEAQDQLHQTIEACRRARDLALHPHRDPETKGEHVPPPPAGVFPRVLGSTHAHPTPATSIVPAKAQYEAATTSLAGLKTLVAGIRLPDEGLDQFLATVRKAVADVGTTNPELLRLVLPYREYINGEEGLSALRRNLERIQPRNTDAQSCDAS
jgi:hypothetical protein